MAANKKGEAVAKLGLDYSQFEQAVKSVDKLTNILAGAVSSAIGNITATAFTKATASLAKFIGGAKDSVRSVYSLGEQLDNLSKRTNIAAEEYQAFALAMEKGISMEDAGRILGDNARRMAQNASLFRDISIKFDAAGKRLEGFWIGVAEKIAPVLNPLLDRLIQLDLSKWGEAFAKPIADAVAIIVQLASDGKLWTTLGEGLQVAILSGVDALQYLGKLGGEVFKAIVSGGFDQGIAHAIDTWEAFVGWMSTAFESVAESIGDALYDAMTDVLSLIYEIFDVAGEISKLLRLESADVVDARIAARAQDIANRRASSGGGGTFPTVEYNRGDSISNTISKILENVGPFSLSGKSNQAVNEFTSSLTEALKKFYDRPEVKTPTKLTNTTAVAESAFGVDSLTAAGGGGGIGNLAVSIAEKQLDKLNEIANLIRGRTDGGRSYENFYRRHASNPTDSSPLFTSPLRNVSLSNY